jgi:nicotinamide-nucleotide amidase
MIKAEIIAIGTELLTGYVVERNSMFLAKELAQLGCVVQWKSIVGDVQKDTEAALHQAASRAAVIVTTGGLGTSGDDTTRRAVSHAVGRRLILNEKALEELERRFTQRQEPFPKNYSRQALFPVRAHILPNPAGMTPGFALHWKERYLLCLPGVPEEMQQMVVQAARSYLSDRLKRRTVIWMPILRTTGLTEFEIKERLKDLFRIRRQTPVKLVSQWTGVDLYFKGVGRSESEVSDMLKPLMEKVQERLNGAIYGKDGETLEAVVGRLLSERQLKLAVAESCTGGLVGHRMTNVPGSSGYLDRVEVCYSNLSKTEVLGVPHRLLLEHGAVSIPVAAAMAKGVRERSRTDLGLAVTGIAGPTGATFNKPVGLVVFAIATKQGVETVSVQFGGDREAVKRQASQKALDLLRHHLLLMI